MRPAGGYAPDMINYANSVDCYQIWADMVCYDEVRNAELDGPKYFCVYAAAATAMSTSTPMRRSWPSTAPVCGCVSAFPSAAPGHGRLDVHGRCAHHRGARCVYSVRAGAGVTKKTSPSGEAFYLYKTGA